MCAVTISIKTSIKYLSFVQHVNICINRFCFMYCNEKRFNSDLNFFGFNMPPSTHCIMSFNDKVLHSNVI